MLTSGGSERSSFNCFGKGRKLTSLKQIKKDLPDFNMEDAMTAAKHREM